MAKQWKKQASVAYGYALTRLALNSYMYFEELPEDYSINEAVRRQEPMDLEFQKLLRDLTNDTISLEEVGALRAQVQNEMECIIAFTDCFRIYEHVLNRIERRFDSSFPLSGLSDQEMASQILNFVTGVKDAADMNRRIQEVIGQLPVRFTKQKYYSMVQEALSAYIGAQGEALENTMYLLRTAGMAELSDEQKANYPELNDYLNTLSQMVFRTMTEEEYRKASGVLAVASEMVGALSEYYQMLQEMINDLYLIAMAKEDAVRDVSKEQCALRILKGLLEMEGRTIPEMVEEELYHLEGVQEEYYEKYLRMEPAPEYQEGEDTDFAKMRAADLLMSSSNFASLEPKKELHEVTRQDVDAAFDDFVKQIDPVLKSCQKPVVRAIMATTLSVLPVCFNSVNEIQEYVVNSLGGCSDLEEKEASIDLIHQLMEMEDYAI